MRAAIQSGQINANTYNPGWVEGLIRKVGKGWEVPLVTGQEGSKGEQPKAKVQEGKGQKKEKQKRDDDQVELQEALLLRRIVKKRLKGGAQ